MFRILFSYLPFALALLGVLLFVLPCRVKTRAQAIWAMVLLLCAAKFICFEAFGGNAFAPELPEYMIWAWNWAYSGMCLLVPLAVLGLCLPRKVRLIVVPLLAWGCAAKGLYNGIKVPAVAEITFTSSAVPESLKDYKILQLSDLHVSAAATRWRTEAIVAKANAVGADLIVVTGDIVDGHPARQRRNLEPLTKLTARDGVYFCMGNHECYHYWQEWSQQYERWGFQFLNNRGLSPTPGLYLAGVTDPAARSCAESLPNLCAALKDASEGDLHMLLQHRPFIDWQHLPTRPRVDLQLSGHTHGGIAPLLDWVVQRYNHGFLKGLQPNPHGGFVYTSPGTGQWAGFPIRFFNDPEITLITLKPDPHPSR